ncbi:MAG: hypothetical protein ACXWVJ_08540, partial [Caulobacteraceae bacterium]
MTELTAANFETLCATPAVKEPLDGIEVNRKKAVTRFWMFLAGGGALTLLLTVVAANVFPAAAVIVFIAGMIAVVVFALRPLGKAQRTVKQPVLEAVARMGGMEYAETGFLPPVFANAQKVLFGGYLSDTTFTDRFNGKDEAGNEFAF